MTESINESEQETSLVRLRELDILREDLIRRQAVMGERHAAAKRDLSRIVGEMKELGTSPETIQGDLSRVSADLKKRTAEYESSLVQLKMQLDKVEEDLDKDRRVIDSFLS